MDLQRIKLFVLLTLLSTPIWAQQVPENLGTSVNSEYLELHPVMAPDGKTLYFTRKNHPQNKFGVSGSETIAGSQDIWFSENNNGIWTPARRMSEVLNRDQYNTILSISPDGQTILLKGAYVNGQYDNRGFSISKKSASGWTIPEKLQIPSYEKMSKGKNETAFLSVDGKILLMAFSEKRNSESDDLYISFLNDGEWSKPENLGPKINTQYSETTPFLSADGRTLYFSSDRPGGKGSFDVYMARRVGKDDWSNWRPAVNLGAPINTEEYDAYYTLPAKGDYAYFLSSKGSLGKKDIYRIKAPKPEELDVADNLASGASVAPKVDSSAFSKNNGLAANSGGKNTADATKSTAATEKLIVQGNIQTDKRLGSSESSNAVVLISGKVLNTQTGQVPEGASITYEDLKTGRTIGLAKPDPNTGLYKLVLPYGINYGITAKAKGMLPSSINIDLSKLRGRYLELEEKDLSMAPIAKGSSMTINNLFFELNKATLTPESEPELQRIVSVLYENNTLVIEISGHTDNTGTDEFNNRLSLERADAVKTYLVGAGIEPVRIKTKGYGKTKPKESNDTEEGRAANRRVEFSIL